MAVVSTKGTAITNRDATPRVLNNAAFAKGTPFFASDTVEIAAGDDDTSKFLFVTVPSNAVIASIKVFCDAITGGTSFDCGLYQTTENGGAAADADLFATAVSLATAITVGTEIRFEAADIAGCNLRVWQLLGLTSDPVRDYDIVLTANTVGTAAGTVSLQVLYAV